MLVPALGLSAWFRAANSTIRAERLRWAGLQAAASSFHRRLLSCSSSLDLLGKGSVSLTGGESWWEAGALGSKDALQEAPGHTVQGQDGVDQTRSLTSMVQERKSGERQDWSTRVCLRAQHPPAGQGEAPGNRDRYLVPTTLGTARGPGSAQQVPPMLSMGHKWCPWRSCPFLLPPHGEGYMEVGETPTASRDGRGCSGSCSCGVHRRMKDSPKRLHGLKGWLQVSRTRSHFCPTVSSGKSAVGESSWGG